MPFDAAPHSCYQMPVRTNKHNPPGLPHTSLEDDVGRQQLSEKGVIEPDPYLAGYLAGFAAANPNGTISEAGASLSSENPNTAWPSAASMNPLPSSLPLIGFPPQPHDICGTSGASISLRPQGFVSDVSLHEQPAMQVDLQFRDPSWEAYGQLLDFDFTTSTANQPSLADSGWFQGSYETANSSASQQPLPIDCGPPLSRQLTRGLTSIQLNGPALSQPRPFAPEVIEGHNAPPPGIATDVEQPWDFATTRALLTTAEVSITQTRGPFDASTFAPQQANVDDLELFLKALTPDTNRNPKRQKSGVSSPSLVVAKRGAKGAVQTVFRAYGHKRSKFNEQSRIRTALTRKLGACAFCREKKLRCDQSSKEKFVPCARCARLPPQLLPGPCCRIELTDIKLFRLGSAANPVVLQQWTLSKESGKGQLYLENGTMALEPPRKVQLTHDITTTSFMVTLSRFLPGPDDATAYNWTDVDGNKRKYELPPYYISDVVEATQNLRQYLRKAREEFPTALLVNSNPIVRKTFKEAERYCKGSKSELVETALMFWSATRMLERFWLICGTDMLGIPPMEQNIGPCRRNPSIDAIPVTPIMDTQLDELVVTGVLVPLKAKLLRLLKARALAKKKEYWYEIYLASFVVLHNEERILDHVVDYARRFGISAEPKSNDEASLSHAYYHACKTILAYFHFASGGAAPLSLDWLDRAQDTSVMNQYQIAYLRDMQAEKLRQDAQLQALKDASMYETELYWCHQILLPDWKADMPHRGTFLEYTENDFLVS